LPPPLFVSGVSVESLLQAIKKRPASKIVLIRFMYCRLYLVSNLDLFLEQIQRSGILLSRVLAWWGDSYRVQGSYD